jgi:hypothetical protein
MADRKLVERVHRRQAVRHVVANKVQLALTILKELELEHAVEPRLIKRAIKDLKAIVKYLNERTKS